MRWLFLIALLFSQPSFAGINNPGSGSSTSGASTTFTHVQIGGAGATVGIASVPSANLLLSRQDQFGCYKSVSNAQWSQLITTTAMPALSVTNADGGAVLGGVGCDMIAGDSLNTNNIWLSYNGNAYFSSNLGASFAATCYTGQTATANASTIKAFDPKIAVDPANSSVVYLSTPSGSLIRTANQGSTCSNVATLAAPTSSGGYLIAFDISGGTTASCAGSASICTKSVYVSVYGTGVYHSNDGGQTWTLTTTTPTTHIYMACDPIGVLWLVDNSGGNGVGTARKYNGVTWSTPSFTGNTVLLAVATDVLHCTLASNCHVVFIRAGGNGWAYTADGGTTWNVTTSSSIVTSDVPWLASQLTGIGFFGAGAAFDGSGQVYIGEEGVFKSIPATSGSVATWTSQTAGIEEFETNQIITSPGTSGSLIIAGWDIGCFTLTAPYTSFPANGGHGCATPNQANLQHGYSLDWDAAAPANLVSLVDSQGGYAGGGPYTGYSAPSINGGSTWGPTFAVPSTVSAGVGGGALKGGCMAVANGGNIMWGPTDGSGGAVAPFLSTNGGVSWTQISAVSGVTGGWPFQYYLSNHQCAGDRVTANTFYFYNWNTGSGSPSDAFIKCTGLSCARVSSPGFGPNEQFNPTLKAVPGQAGYLFFAYGTVQPPQDIVGNGFYFSVNGLSSITTIPNATGVSAFGFGAPFPGHTFPTIIFSGWYNHVYGLWRSIDWDGAQTWQNIGTYPLNIPLSVWDIDGDKTLPGVFYFGTVSGVFCGALNTSQCNGGT